MTEIISSRAGTLASWGKRIKAIDTETKDSVFSQARAANPWFTSESIGMALDAVLGYLDEDALNTWLSDYEPRLGDTKTIGLIMAGNIPLVGFHDLLCVLASGHRALVKLSSKDSVLLPFLIDQLREIDKDLASQIVLTDRLKDFDAVIATGSDNSARYFDYYFGKYPHIIRKNRTSVAVLTGDESDQDLLDLGLDVFTYFGLGCRNVSKVFAPEGYDFKRLFNLWETYKPVIEHNKYRNNYDYQLAILLVNKVDHFDNGFLLVTESDNLVSPISVLYVQYYQSPLEAERLIEQDSEKLQCVVGKARGCNVSFGQAQHPGLGDYADHVDTMKFLLKL